MAASSSVCNGLKSDASQTQATRAQGQTHSAEQLTTENDEQAYIAQLCELPPCAQVLSSNTYTQLINMDQKEFKKLIGEAVPWVVELAAIAPRSQKAKDVLNGFLSLGPNFASNLRFAGQWERLKAGCNKKLKLFADALDNIFQRDDLREKLGTYTPPQPLDSGVSDLLHNPRCQFVPPAVALGTFDSRDAATTYDLECTYIHFLRLLAKSYDICFQDAVRSVLQQHGLDSAVVTSSGIKGYGRMHNKMWSWGDHGPRSKPRAQHNIDIVRCLVSVDSAADMVASLDALTHIFEGKSFVKFKNGMAWERDEASSRHHLRLILVTGKFVFPSHRSMAALRNNPEVQAAWDSYLYTEVLPPSCARGTWKRNVLTARDWINNIADHVEMSMLCEVQLLLTEYKRIRHNMHTLYKIVRAADPQALAADYSQYNSRSNVFARHGRTPIFAACRDGNDAAVAKLLPSAPSETVEEALVIAARYLQGKCIELLLPRVDNVVTRNTALRNATASAPEKEHFSFDAMRQRVVRQLIACKTDVNDIDKKGITPLYLAAMKGYVNIVTLLLHAKANPCQANLKSRTTPVSAASQTGHADVISVLAKHSADVNAVDSLGWSPVAVAVSRKQVLAVRALAEAKADIDNPVDKTYWPLYLGCLNGCAEVVEVLVSFKSDVNNKNTYGATALQGAATNGSILVLEVLIRASADMTSQNLDGMSPLMVAVGQSKPLMVSALLKHTSGAEQYALRTFNEFEEWGHKFPVGSTAMDVARICGEDEIVALLREQEIRFASEANSHAPAQ